MVKIMKIGVLSLCKIFAILYGLMGVVMGAYFALISLIFGGLATPMMSTGIGAMMFGIGAVIFLPIL